MGGITGGRDAARVAHDFAARGPGSELFGRQMQAAMRRQMERVVPDLRAAVLASRAKGPRSSGLRRQMAGAVKVKAPRSEPSVRLMIDASEMPPGRKTLPAYREGVRKRWRRPTFGNKGKKGWQDQPAVPVFYPRVRARYEPLMNATVEREADRLAEKLNRG